MRLILSNISGVPIYEQIKTQIKEAILSNDLGEGDALPSLRQLARDLKVSVLTVNRAYGDLEAEGYITNMQGRGAYVLPKGNEMIREQWMREMEEGLRGAIAAAKKTNLSLAEVEESLKLLWEVENEGTNDH